MTNNRLIWSIRLEPATGSFFQPTGFPDVGAARFRRPERDDGALTYRECLLVESAQSMANHLEGVGWNPAEDEPVAELAGLPWVRVVAADDGRFLTSSRVEAHRLGAAFVKDGTLDGQDVKQVIRDRFGLRDDTPLDHRRIAREIFALDPLCLIHGVFFAESAKVWPGQPKTHRALTAIIEAVDVEPVISGGVKRDVVRHGISEGEKGAKEGYGSIPFHRQEFAAAEITLHVSLDRLQLRSYGLGDDAAGLLEAVALWELRTLLDRGLRLRTACDLVPVDDSGLPPADELAGQIRDGAASCADRLGPGGPVEVVWKG
ncbi:MAG: type I-G CRISPR-associated RAMP protein Csb1/Cas7g [Acidimicrobiales bacterium]